MSGSPMCSTAPFEGPSEADGEVWLRGCATDRRPGFPEFVLVLEETARFEGGSDPSPRGLLHGSDGSRDAL
ncbi:MAG: hypothetical protein ABGX04_07130, partial [Myxococcales bacterium]